jgi:hypothetical protein
MQPRKRRLSLKKLNAVFEWNSDGLFNTSCFCSQNLTSPRHFLSWNRNIHRRSHEILPLAPFEGAQSSSHSFNPYF